MSICWIGHKKKRDLGKYMTIGISVFVNQALNTVTTDQSTFSFLAAYRKHEKHNYAKEFMNFFVSNNNNNN